ncbi:MAG: hypothetical protein ABFC80_00510 [Coriobacteriales bacterium]|nr:hypothetical protein [Actinomycetes bacterium]
MSLLDSLLAITSALVVGVLVPWGAMRMLLPVLRDTAHARMKNYRGRDVFLGLGVVWLVWAGGAMVAGIVLPVVFPGLRATLVLALAGLVALAGFSFGLVDDALGTREVRGFRGHVRAIMTGRLTTGGLKLVGISAASIGVAALLAVAAPWSRHVRPWGLRDVALVLLAAAAVALTSNFVNLMDLRPGRALKTYCVLACVGVVSVVFGLGPYTGELAVARGSITELTVFALMLLGPVFAVWRYDLGEEGMLGDAGANAMGAAVGVTIASGLPTSGLVAYAVVMLVLNLLSERLSFSAVIERTPVLAWLDSIGRRREHEVPEPPPEADDTRYDGPDDHDSREA